MKNKLTEKELISLFDKIAESKGDTVKIVVKDELVDVDKETLSNMVSGLYFDLKKDELIGLIKKTGIKKRVLAERLNITPVRFSQIVNGSVKSAGNRSAIDIINEGIKAI